MLTRDLDKMEEEDEDEGAKEGGQKITQKEIAFFKNSHQPKFTQKIMEQDQESSSSSYSSSEEDHKNEKLKVNK